MQKIIRGFGAPVFLDGVYNPTSWVVRVFEVNGHREISARNAIDWQEDPDGVLPVDQSGTLFGEEQAEERRQKALKASARRAQTKCRRIIKSEAFNELLTLTYRENQGDRDLCKKHFSIWQKRMKRALGDFRFCASFEKQKRGAMHVHIATHKLPEHALHKGVKIKAWQLGTKIWRDIVGVDNGLCFVGGVTRFGGSRRNMSLGKMASYVSKYILKDYQDCPGDSNRYSRSNGINLPKPVTMTFTNLSFARLIELCFRCDDGDVILSHRADSLNNVYWLCTEPLPP